MEFNKKNKEKLLGKYLGFIAMFFIFAAVLYFILKLIGKSPNGWNFLYALFIVFFIILLGKLIKFLLKT